MKTLKITLAAVVIAASATSAFAIDSSGRGDRVTSGDLAGNDSAQLSDSYVPAQGQAAYVQPVFTPGFLFLTPATPATPVRMDREGEGASHQ